MFGHIQNGAAYASVQHIRYVTHTLTIRKTYVGYDIHTLTPIE